eukprot:COSAG01_NODE_1915_length_8918_cov_21.920853_9_plen_82_part_00
MGWSLGQIWPISLREPHTHLSDSERAACCCRRPAGIRASYGLPGWARPAACAFSNSLTPGLRAELCIGANGRGGGGGTAGQ